PATGVEVGVGAGVAAARSASASAFVRFVASTSAASVRSCRKKLRPIEYTAARLSAVQPMKSPPTFVKRQLGSDPPVAAETVGTAGPPIGGTVTMYTLRFARTSARRPSGESSTSSGVEVAGAPPAAGGGAGAVTFSTVLKSVPSMRTERSPSAPPDQT